MIIDTSPYTIVQAPGVDAVLLVQIEGATVATIRIDTPIDATAPDGLHAELARLIGQTPNLFLQTRRFVEKVRTFKAKSVDSYGGMAPIVDAIEGPPASPPPAPPVPTEGWVHFPGLSSKWHYCTKDRHNRSLCGGFGALTMAKAEQGKNDHPDNCKACQKKLAARLARADRRAREIEGNS